MTSFICLWIKRGFMSNNTKIPFSSAVRFTGSFCCRFVLIISTQTFWGWYFVWGLCIWLWQCLLCMYVETLGLCLNFHWSGVCFMFMFVFFEKKYGDILNFWYKNIYEMCFLLICSTCGVHVITCVTSGIRVISLENRKDRVCMCERGTLELLLNWEMPFPPPVSLYFVNLTFSIF